MAITTTNQSALFPIIWSQTKKVPFAAPVTRCSLSLTSSRPMTGTLNHLQKLVSSVLPPVPQSGISLPTISPKVTITLSSLLTLLTGLSQTLLMFQKPQTTLSYLVWVLEVLSHLKNSTVNCKLTQKLKIPSSSNFKNLALVCSMKP